MSKLQDFIAKTGRTPQVRLEITPLNSNNGVDPIRQPISLTQFLSYQFTSSILIPVDAFSFSFALPQVVGAINSIIQEGDIAELYAGDSIICTGIIDVVEIETTREGGDVVSVHGRNLLGQLEDSSAVNSQNETIFGKSVPLALAVGTLTRSTRIRGLSAQGVPSGNYLFATEPGESKLSAIQRFVEPLNCLIWATPKGYLSIGRPNMGAGKSGDIVCDSRKRFSNVLSIKAVRASAQIANSVLPLYSGQETVQVNLQQQVINNASAGPARLRQAGHFVQKCIVTSSPDGNNPQGFSDVNALDFATRGQFGPSSEGTGSALLQAYGYRLLARENIGELSVQANVKGHFNDDLIPFLIDQSYAVNYYRAGAVSKMYVYQVDYSCDAKTGPKTSVHLCLPGRIVAGAFTRPYVPVITNSARLPTI